MTSPKPTPFTRAMFALYERTKRETGYNPTAFFDMLSRLGGEETARRLIHAPRQSDGYTKLYLMTPPRLDLTVEAFVVESAAWQELLGPETVAKAMRRLEDCRYKARPPS